MSRQLDALKECLSEAALDDDALPRLPQHIAALVDGMSCIVLHQPAAGVIETFTYNVFGAEHLPIYVAEFAADDPWTGIALQHGVNRAVSSDRYLPLAEFERTRIYNEFARPYALEPAHCMSLILPTRAGTGVIGIQRNRRQGAFGAAEEETLQRAVPELQRFVEIRARLAYAERRAASAEAMFDRLAMGVLLVDAQCRVLFGNESALLLLRRDDGLAYSSGQRLSAENHADAIQLRTAIAKISSRDSSRPAATQGLLVARSSGAAALQLLVTPFWNERVLHAASALILVRDPETDRRGLAPALAQMFGLSAGEAEVALALSEGKTAQQIADERAVFISTVHTQIKRALEKTGTRRQTALVATINKMPLLRPK